MEEIVKLDVKDTKILQALDFNGRISYTSLGKKTGISKQMAEYRVQSLMKKGVIKGFYPVIHSQKLGYIYCRLMVTLQNTTREKRNGIVVYLISHSKVFWLIEMQGIYDLTIVLWAKSITDFKDFIEEFEGTFGEHIKRKTETIATDVVHFQHRYLTGSEKSEELHLHETSERVSIDELDKKILQLLCSDGRFSLVDIAGKTKTSAKVVAYRLKRMEEQRLILGYRPIVNHSALGYTYYKLFLSLNRISKESLVELKAYIKKNTAVVYFVEGIGLPGDIDMEMIVKSNQELFSFIEDLRFAFPKIVGEYQPVVFTETRKVKYLPF